MDWTTPAEAALARLFTDDLDFTAVRRQFEIEAKKEGLNRLSPGFIKAHYNQVITMVTANQASQTSTDPV